MMRLRVVKAVAATTFREFWRSKDAVFWTYGFPILMAIVLGFAFQPKPLPPVPIALIADGGAPAVLAALAAEPRLSLRTLPPAAADAALARGVVDLVVRFDAGQPVLRGHPMRSEGRTGDAAGRTRARCRPRGSGPPIAQEIEDRPGARYIDFLIPGCDRPQPARRRHVGRRLQPGAAAHPAPAAAAVGGADAQG